MSEPRNCFVSKNCAAERTPDHSFVPDALGCSFMPVFKTVKDMLDTINFGTSICKFSFYMGSTGFFVTLKTVVY